jgi:hypothetical protein
MRNRVYNKNASIQEQNNNNNSDSITSITQNIKNPKIEKTTTQ